MYIKKFIKVGRDQGFFISVKKAFRFLVLKMKERMKKRIVIDPFELHSQLVDQIWGAPEDIAVGRVSTELLQELKAEFCSDTSFLGGASQFAYKTNPVLEIDRPSESVLEGLGRNVIPGNMHEYDYSNKVIKRLHDELRQIFKRHVGSPFVFVNTRIWKSKAKSQRFGPNAWHTDGFAPGHLKIMLYLTPLNNEYGTFSWRDSSGNDHHLDDNPTGTTVCFRNSEVEHSGVPGSVHERISIEVTLMRSLVDGQQEWPGHFLGRHLKSPKQLENIANLDTSQYLTEPEPKHFNLPDFSGKKKVNIGSGVRDWPEWVCLDELNAPGVTKLSFSENSEFPIKEKTVSLFYSSHFFEHISDEVVCQVLSEMKKCALPGALFVLKIPDFSWFLEQHKYNMKDSMNNKGVESVLWSWGANGVKDNFENRLAMMFCGYWTQAYGDHFSGDTNHHAEGAYHGPPKLPIEQTNQILANNAPHEITRELVAFATKDTALKSFNHRNAWSEGEMVELLSKLGIKVLHTKRNLILDQFKEVIPDLESMHNWSAYYLCEFPN